MYPEDWDLERERAFQKWFDKMTRLSVFLGSQPPKSVDPDDPENKYDYRAAYLDHLEDGWDLSPEGHWPKQYRIPDTTTVTVTMGGAPDVNSQ